MAGETLMTIVYFENIRMEDLKSQDLLGELPFCDFWAYEMSIHA